MQVDIKSKYKIFLILIEILIEAIGLFFVLETFYQTSLSEISFTIHPAERIRTDPKKNNDKIKK